MSTLERLRAVIDVFADGNVAAFSRRIGVKDSTIRAWLGKRGANLTLENLEKICVATGVSADWLLSGGGSMLAGPLRKPRASKADSGRSAADTSAEGADRIDRTGPASAATEARLLWIISRGSDELSDEFKAGAAKELERLIGRKRGES
jgi:hypothetical protein